MRKSTGKAKSLRVWRTEIYNSGFIKFDLIDLSDDFADVDLREELCYHSRPRKSATSEGLMLLLECKKSGVISLGGLHPYLPQIYRIWLKNDLKITF